MTLEELAEEYLATQPTLALDGPQAFACILAAARYYAAYGDITSISQSDRLPGAPGPGADYPVEPDPAPEQRAALPVKSLFMLDELTELTAGEWSIIRPLFVLYAERMNASLLEASRGMGVDVYGRTVSEIAQDISVMESDTLPGKCFAHVLIEV